MNGPVVGPNRFRYHRWGVGFALLLVMSAFGTRLSAQSRETLETRIIGQGDALVLSWSDKHPWDAELLAGAPALLAEYRSGGHPAALDCFAGAPARGGRAYGGYGCSGIHGTADRGPRERSLRFELPDALTATPDGPVCLVFRMPNGRVLPLRRATQQRDETARFEYAGWEQVVRRNTALIALRTRMDSINRAIPTQEQAIRSLEESNARNGWTSADVCERIVAPSLRSDSHDRPIAEPPQFEQIARRVCIMRVANADRRLSDSLIKRLRYGAAMSPPMLDRIIALLAPPERSRVFDATRRAQYAEYNRDWREWAPRVEEYLTQLHADNYTLPHFGTTDDVLAIQMIAADSIGSDITHWIEQRKPLPLADVAGYLGTSLEAYTRCVADGQAQLATTYRSARDLSQRNPALEASARQTLVGACKRDVSNIEAMRASLQSLQLHRAEVAQAIETFTASAPRSSDAAELNNAACAP